MRQRPSAEPGFFVSDSKSPGPRAALGAEGRNGQRRQLPQPDGGRRGRVSRAARRTSQQALAYAKAAGLTVSPAGVRHSMGGQAFRRGGIMLDMRGMNAIRARSRAIARSRSARARPGTTSRTPSIRASRSRRCSRPTSSPSAARSRSMPTAWTIRPGAIRNSIRSLRVMLADGRIVTASRDGESGALRPRRRRLRPVRDHPVGRARCRSERHLPLASAS